MTTVTAVKRALEETARDKAVSIPDANALFDFAQDPTVTTVLANRLSDRGEAGNEAARRNIGDLNRIAQDLRFTRDRVGNPGCWARRDAATKLEALEWAIEQLTPPERA